MLAAVEAGAVVERVDLRRTEVTAVVTGRHGVVLLCTTWRQAVEAGVGGSHCREVGLSDVRLQCLGRQMARHRSLRHSLSHCRVCRALSFIHIRLLVQQLTKHATLQ